VNAFDVRIYTIRRRKGRRRPFQVRWQAAGQTRSKSFPTRGLADSYRAELVRAARQGLEFDPHSSAACITPRYAPRKPWHCAVPISSCLRTGAAS